MIFWSWLNNGVFIAIMAQGLIGISLVWDKVLLRQPQTKNLLNYVFWLGAISIFGLGVIPFGFHFPAVWIMGVGFLTGILDLAASYAYYAALKGGEASQTLAIMGGFTPVATILFAQLFVRQQITADQAIGFVILVVAGFVMFFSEHLNLKQMIPRIIIASVLFGLEATLQKLVFDHTDFVSGFVFITLGTFFGAMFFLVRRCWREQIFTSSEKALPKSRFWYLVNRFMAGLGSFLTFYAVSLTHPALVEAIAGVRYVIIFLGAYTLTKLLPGMLEENFRGWTLVAKSAATLMVVVGLVLLAFSKAPVGTTSSTTAASLGFRNRISGGHWLISNPVSRKRI